MPRAQSANPALKISVCRNISRNIQRSINGIRVGHHFLSVYIDDMVSFEILSLIEFEPNAHQPLKVKS